MKVKLDTDVLQSSLALLRTICFKLNSLPILACVLIEAADGVVKLTGTNLDLGLELRLPAEVETPGKISVSAARLAAGVGRVIGPVVELVGTSKNDLLMSSGDMWLELFGFPAEDLPELPSSKHYGPEVRIAAAQLKPALSRCLPFVSDDATRYTLNGVYFNQRREGLYLVATDGRRLIRQTLEVTETSLSAIVPSAACKLLVALSAPGDMILRFDANQMEVTCAGERGWRLVAKLLEGNYPNYDQVIPPDEYNSRKITVDRKPLSAVLPFVEVTTDGKQPGALLTVEDSGSLLLTTLCPDVGKASVTLPCENTKGAHKVLFNIVYLAAALKCFTGETVTLAMRDGQSPTVIKEGGTLVVLMPMRIS